MFRTTLLLLSTALFLCVSAQAQTVPTPKDHFGFNIGDDYQLATYTQTEAYFKKLAASPRTKLTSIGKTEEGRDQFMMIVTSPENHKKLARYQEISTKMARAEGLTEQQARAMAEEGKAVVWIDGGLHATETVGTHQLIETAYQLVSRTDPETMRILDNVVILLTHANPDGQEIVSNWYMRNPAPEKRSLDNLPRLYEKYAGHDNNRDFYIMNLKESQNIGRQLFVDWIPQIMYNHHQRGPAGSVLAGPPYRDPFNYVFDPLMITGIDALGAAMYNRLNAENKPGFTRLGGSVFSTWYNGGLRTTTHFHNMIGLLTEIIGGPTPENVPLIPSRLIPNGNTPNPVTPQRWRFRQSIDYSVSLNYAVLDYAARQRDQLLYNIYKMGKNSIDRGSENYWTLSPKRVETINELYQADLKKTAPGVAAPANATVTSAASRTATVPASATALGSTTAVTDAGSAPRGEGVPMKYFTAVLRDTTLRDPRGYIIPSSQTDWPTAVKFVNALIKTGIQVLQATADFSVAGKTYPAGSYVVKLDQAFRPHVLDMFEPQDHPNDFQYPGGPPVRPYDAAGWTLAYQMNVQFDRLLTGFDGPFKKLPYGELQAPTAKISGSGAGYVLNSQVNNAFLAVNDLIKAGVEVYRMPTSSAAVAPGSFYVPASAKAKSILDASGMTVTSIAKRPTTMKKVTPMRIGLWDTYGGSMPSGWVRWLMEQYHYPMQLVYAKDIDAGNLKSKYDVIVFVTRAIPAVGNGNAPARGEGETGGFREPKAEEIPAEYHPSMGRITADKSVPQLKAFMEAGGQVVTIGTSTNLAYHLGLPVRNALVEMGPNGQERPLSNEKYFIPGSILRVALDSTQQATWGMPTQTDVYFDSSPVFKIAPEAIAKGTVKPLMWFPTDKPLRSGWAWGQAYLRDGVTAFMAPIGAGKLYAFGPEITFRAQAQGTFKLLFNQLYGLGE
ncbi:M14 family metallopeptidase [Fibrella forsythiae]|uniref:Peptidase n=1 Tax=Fibrella forsythiae TaxID=2817061 RepID=A0ABS3JJF4_9BACT|nr:M14 metallopeptidase family protein [Fibrella forsythiae]MBO0950140.1 peptidase [Fibrella forsythiae]